MLNSDYCFNIDFADVAVLLPLTHTHCTTYCVQRRSMLCELRSTYIALGTLWTHTALAQAQEAFTLSSCKQYTRDLRDGEQIRFDRIPLRHSRISYLCSQFTPSPAAAQRVYCVRINCTVSTVSSKHSARLKLDFAKTQIVPVSVIACHCLLHAWRLLSCLFCFFSALLLRLP